MEFWLDEECGRRAERKHPPRRRPLAGLSLAVTGGAAAGIGAGFSAAWFLGAGALLLPPLFLWVRRRGSTGLLMLAAFCLMAAHARMSTGGRPGITLGSLLSGPVEYVPFVAVALEDAVPRPARPGQTASAVFPARIEGVNRDGTWRRVDDRIRVVLRGDPENRRLPRYGERWRLRGVVRPDVPRRSGLFTLPENQAVVDPDRAVFLDAGRGNPLKAWCLDRRRAAREILARGLEDYPAERGLLQALLLGYREDLPSLLREDFAVTGTVHIFAISGAHVGMVTMLLAGLLRALGVPRPRWFLLAAPLLAAYTVTTGAATSAIRASVMASLLLAAPFLRRKPDAVSTLAGAAMVLLLASPGQLGDLGFLLSFTAVGGLVAVQPVFDAWALRTFRRDVWQLPEEEQPEGRHRREAGLHLARYASVSVSAWVSTAPLTAFFFNLFSPVALAMNLVVIPAAFVILLSGVMSLACAVLPGGISEVFNHAARVIAQGLALLIRWAASVPGGHGFVRTPPAAGVAAWYAVLAVAAVMARRVRGALPAGLALLVAMGAAWGAMEARRCRVSVLEAGDGQAVLVQARGARVLVDTGPAYRADRLLRQLRRQGVNQIDVMILTHSDADHMGAAVALMQEVPVRELWLPAATWPSPKMREVVQSAEAAGMPVRRVRAGDEGDWPGDIYWEVLWPPEAVEMSKADDTSLVLRVARYGVSILLASDAGAEQESALRARGAEPAAAVLLAGRHGEADATTEGWLEAVRPRDILISTGLHVDGKRPDEGLLERLAKRGIRVWRTDREGGIHLDLAGRPARWPDPGYRIRTDR